MLPAATRGAPEDLTAGKVATRMAKRVKFVAGGQKADLAEARALVLLQPRKSRIYETREEYAAAPTLPTLSLEQVLALGLEARAQMKAAQSKFWGRPWAEMASDRSLLGGMATTKPRRR
jgi:hypothetical protein